MMLKEYVNEIIAIAEANDMSWDIGADMFIANIRNSGDPELPYYKGAFVDYETLKLFIEDMTDEEIADMKNEFAAWYREHADEIRKARGGE